jgi:predicted nuclease with TOPRIM domain
MAENNAVTKEELKEVVDELRQEFRQGLAETNQNVLELRHKVDGLEHKVDGLEHKVDGLEHKVDGLEHKVDGLEHKVDANDRKLEAFRAETLARFDVVDAKHDAVVKAILDHQKKTDAQFEEVRGMLSKLMTGMDAQMKEHEILRHEQISLGVIQDRQGKDIEAIKKHLGLEGSNGNLRKITKVKRQSSKRNKKS